MKSRSVKRNAKNARGLGRDRESETVRIFLTACSDISAPDIPSDWSIVRVNISPTFLAATAPFPKSRASYFRFARFNTSALYYLRAWRWHRLIYMQRLVLVPSAGIFLGNRSLFIAGGRRIMLGLTRRDLADPSFECYFTEVIPSNNI